MLKGWLCCASYGHFNTGRPLLDLAAFVHTTCTPTSPPPPTPPQKKQQHIQHFLREVIIWTSVSALQGHVWTCAVSTWACWEKGLRPETSLYERELLSLAAFFKQACYVLVASLCILPRHLKQLHSPPKNTPPKLLNWITLQKTVSPLPILHFA